MLDVKYDITKSSSDMVNESSAAGHDARHDLRQNHLAQRLARLAAQIERGLIECWGSSAAGLGSTENST